MLKPSKFSLRIQKLIVGVLGIGFLVSAFWLKFSAGSYVTSTPVTKVFWARWDVTISAIDTTDNVFHVSENHDLMVLASDIHGGDRAIPLDRATSIENIHVFDSDQELRRIQGGSDACGLTPGLVCLSQSSGLQAIYYNFFTTGQSFQSHSIRYEYDVHGALRSYPGGDQLWWKALADDRPAQVEAARVTVELPAGLNLHQIATYPNTWNQDSTESGRIVFDAPGELGGSENVEIRLEYDHNPAMSPPPWQATFDRVQTLQPVVELALLTLDGLLFVGGILLVLIREVNYRRYIPPIALPEYLAEPPSDLSPGAAGALLDGRVDGHDMVATLIDLARRGYIVIEQEQRQGLSQVLKRLPGNSPFVFHRTARPPAGQRLRAHEGRMLSAVFPGSYGSTTATCRLNQFRRHFRQAAPGISTSIRSELLTRDYFVGKSLKATFLYVGLGLLLLDFFVAGFTLGGFSHNTVQLDPANPGLPITVALLIAGLAMLVASKQTRVRTPTGEVEAAKWKAFRRYLKHIRRYGDNAQANQKFEQYIGYAVAFRLGKRWVRQLSPRLTTMPIWFYPVAIYGPWTGQGVQAAGGANAGLGSLNAASTGLTQGLNALNFGLVALLNGASLVMGGQMVGGAWAGGGLAAGASGGGFAGFH